MKLGKLQRLGIVLSILWVIGATCYQAVTTSDNGLKILNNSLAFCLNVNPSKECWSEWERDREAMTDPYWKMALLNSMIPVPIVWFLVCLSIFTYRWVMRGGGKSSP